MDATSESLALATLRALHEGTLSTDCVFGSAPVGDAPIRLICNSLPKAGTYLLLELVKRAGFADVGFHLNTDHIEKRTADEQTEQPRYMPSVLQVAALKTGQAAPAHLHYSFVLENYLLSQSDVRTLFIIRDPRDLVISWVDFVFSSAAYRSTRWNTYRQMLAREQHATDDARISSSIEGLLGMGLQHYLPWLDSSACLTIRFEELLANLSQGGGPVLDRIALYIGRPLGDLSNLLGRSRTASGRPVQVGIYKHRMNEHHLQRTARADFAELIIKFGYEPD